MAIFHYSQNGIRMCEGGSAVCHSAYISGAKLFREKTGALVRSGDPARVMEGGIALPKDAPEAFENRETLWNAAEAAWGGGTETVAHRANMALPIELGDDLDAYREIVREFAEKVAKRMGCAVEYAIHAPTVKGGGWHAHTMKSDLRVGKNGFERPSSSKTAKLYLCRDPHGNDCYVKSSDWKQAKTRGYLKVYNLNDGMRRSMKEAEEAGLTKADRKSKTPVAVTVLPDGTRAFNAEKAELVGLRELWADCCNGALEKRGIDARIDHRSNMARGMAKEPTVSLAPGEYRRELAERESARREGREAVPVSKKGEENAIRRARNRAIEGLEAAQAELERSERELEATSRAVLEDAERWSELHAEELSLRNKANDFKPTPDEIDEAKNALLEAEATAREAESLLRAKRFDFRAQARKTANVANIEVEKLRARKAAVDARAKEALAIEERADALWRECSSILQSVSRAIRSMADDLRVVAVSALHKRFPEFTEHLERHFPWVQGIGKAEIYDSAHPLVLGIESGVRTVGSALREVEGDRAALREKCRIAAAKSSSIAGFTQMLEGLQVETRIDDGLVLVGPERGALIPAGDLDAALDGGALLCRLYDNAIAGGIVPDERCKAANLRREDIRVEAERVAASKAAFLNRLEKAYSDYRSFCMAHEGIDFKAFPVFKGRIPEELRGDREVRLRVSDRLRDAERLRYRYASNAPNIKPMSGQAIFNGSEQPSNRRVVAIDATEKGVWHER